MTTPQAIQLLKNFRAGKASRDQVLHAFQAAPTADIGFAQVDTHRALRKGFPEVVFGAGKTPAQVAINWLLGKPGVSAPIIGATKPGHLADAVGALDIALEPEEVAALEAPYRPHRVLGHS